MGRPPSNGGPAFRFTSTEVAEMEAILQEHNNTMPAREILVGLADKFSESADRKGKITVQMKQVWNWFQNRRYAVRAKLSRNPGMLSMSSMPQDDPTPVRNLPQPTTAPLGSARGASENFVMEFEAKSGRDGAWYDVANFFSHRYLESGDPEVLVRFVGFGPEEDEWVNIRKHIRQRSLPCESLECVAVLPGDLILCFQEGKEQALYFDAHVLDAQRRRHDVRGCRCRFLVRYDHDQSEEIVPLRKVCRRPETDCRLQQLHAESEAASAEQQKSSMDTLGVGALRASIPAETMQKQHKANAAQPVPVGPLLHGNASLATKASILESKKVEIGSLVAPGNPNNFTASGDAILGGSSASNNPIVSGKKTREGKAMRAGYGRSIFEPLLPIILGRDVSGEVAAVGALVRTLNVGQEVFGALHPTAVRGTYADYAILSEDELTPKPVSVTHVEASAIPFAALTAWRALKSTVRITEGQRVLVVGGGGAVGFAAIQLAVAAGCSVTTTCGSQSVHRTLAAGAEQSVDYTTEDVELAIKGKFDAVLDTIGIIETERIGISFLKRGGHYMTLQGEAASLADSYGLAIGLPLAAAIQMKKQIQYRYSHGIEYSWTYMRADSEGLDVVRRLSEAGKLKIPVDKTFPITQVTEAHRAKDKKHIPGKVVLELD